MTSLRHKPTERLFQWAFQEDRFILYNMNIGHLMLFLDQHLTGWWKLQRDRDHTLWWVHCQDESFEGSYEEELIDALWNVVSQILQCPLIDMPG